MPIPSFLRSLRFRQFSPQRCIESLKGPGPRPSCFRAREKVVQGIPIHTKLIRPALIQLLMRYSICLCNTSWSGNMQISTGNVVIPDLHKADEIRAMPAKISNAKVCGFDLHVKTSVSTGSSSSLRRGDRETLSRGFGVTNDKTPCLVVRAGSRFAESFPPWCNGGRIDPSATGPWL